MIALDGRLQAQNWTDRDGNKRVSTEIVAENAYFADSKRDESTASEDKARGRGRKAA